MASHQARHVFFMPARNVECKPQRQSVGMITLDRGAGFRKLGNHALNIGADGNDHAFQRQVVQIRCRWFAKHAP